MPESHPGIYWQKVFDLIQITAGIVLIWRDIEKKYKIYAGVFVILKPFRHLTMYHRIRKVLVGRDIKDCLGATHLPLDQSSEHHPICP